MYFDITKPAFITVEGGQRFPIRITEMINDPMKTTEIRAEIVDIPERLKRAYFEYANLASKRSSSEIKNVIFNDPATIVFWSDGTKTVVKAQNGEVFDCEKGLAMAIAKKHFGNEGNYCNHLKKWLKDSD